MDTEKMVQEAPFPQTLAELVKRVTFKPGWTFELEHLDRGQGSKGLTLNIIVAGRDSYNPARLTNVAHYMIVPAAAYDERAWTRWLFDQCVLVETHEACEHFKIDGDRPYAPNHGPGRNPYSIIEKGSLKDATTLSDGRPAKKQPRSGWHAP